MLSLLIFFYKHGYQAKKGAEIEFVCAYACPVFFCVGTHVDKHAHLMMWVTVAVIELCHCRALTEMSNALNGGLRHAARERA